MTLTHLQQWTRPSRYIGAEWNGYYRFLGRNRDSDALERANFDAGLAAVKAVASKDSIPGDPDESATVQTVCENHWAVGWIEWIAIHESDTAALQVADEILARLEDYPVVDESLYSEYEDTEATAVWRDCFRVPERVEYIRKHRSQFEFRNWQDMAGCVRGRYFAGYASELLH